MTGDAISLISKRQLEFLAFRKALTEESDRGCALFAAAFLDKTLSDILRLSLVEDTKIEKELFEGTTPLSSFSSRIKMTYFLGIISTAARIDLDVIRKIRNAFAHKADSIAFDTQSVADLCRNLAFSYHGQQAKPRAHFTGAASGLLAMLHVTEIESVRPKIKADDAPTEAEKRAVRVVFLRTQLGTVS